MAQAEKSNLSDRWYPSTSGLPYLHLSSSPFPVVLSAHFRGVALQVGRTGLYGLPSFYYRILRLLAVESLVDGRCNRVTLLDNSDHITDLPCLLTYHQLETRGKKQAVKAINTVTDAQSPCQLQRKFTARSSPGFL